jgi:hypothetical protein
MWGQDSNLTLADKVRVIHLRLEGESYSDVLTSYQISSHTFHRAVTDIQKQSYTSLYRILSRDVVQQVKSAVRDEQQCAELFNMGRDYLKEQLEALQNGDECKLPSGATLHKDNAFHLIDIVLHQIKGFAEADRGGKIKLIRDELIGYRGGAKEYFKDKKLGSLLNYGPFRKPNSPTAALELWDEYQSGPDNPSIFDLEQDIHIRFWDIKEMGMWTADNAYKAINYALHQIDGFAEADRKGKVELIDDHVVNYPRGTRHFFAFHDLDGMLKQAPLRRKNPVAAMEFWDAKYSKDNETLSLFSKTELPCLIIKGGAQRQYLKVQYAA